MLPWCCAHLILRGQMGVWELVIFFKEHIFLRAHEPMLSTMRTRWPELGIYIPEDNASVCKDKVFGRGRRVVSPVRERLLIGGAFCGTQHEAFFSGLMWVAALYPVFSFCPSVLVVSPVLPLLDVACIFLEWPCQKGAPGSPPQLTS